MCPGCGRKMESYTNMYNHCTRLSATDKAHAEALDRHILEASGKGANPVTTGNQGPLETTEPTTTGDNDPIDMMFQDSQQVS